MSLVRWQAYLGPKASDVTALPVARALRVKVAGLWMREEDKRRSTLVVNLECCCFLQTMRGKQIVMSSVFTITENFFVCFVEVISE